MPDRARHSPSFARRVLVAASIVLLLLALAALLWIATSVFLLAFAAVLLAVFLQSVAEPLARHTPLPYPLCLALFVLVLLGAIVGFGVLVGPNLATQFIRLIDLVPSALESLRDQLGQYGWGRALLERVPDIDPSVQGLVSRVTGVFSAVLGGLTSTVVVLVTGLYLAIQPDLYVSGLIKLVPRPRRDRACQIVAAEARALRRWLLGRLVSMVVVGILTTVGLWILGIPLALSLGVLAGALSFVPYLGPILSVVPALLVALLQGASDVLAVAVLYGGVQVVESYLITPVIQSHAVSLPPALLLLTQVLLGTLLGFTGILVATPLTVAVIVLIQTLYLEDVLGDQVTPLGG